MKSTVLKWSFMFVIVVFHLLIIIIIIEMPLFLDG